jgi:uncharacterized protein
VYGPNASGKSRLLDALVFFKWFINNSATEKASNDISILEPFEFNESSAEKPSLFEMSFTLGKMHYRYGFEADKHVVHKEWLLESKAVKEYPVFLRIDQKVEIDFMRFENA